ncbi:MAG: HD domain-containing phosphohydrolase [Candidatus Deferrimicrobium sp.]
MNLMPTILCVDDDPLNRHLLEAILVPRGYAPVMAENGMEALEKIREGRIDVVLLDVMMPKMDGFEVCRRIKADERYRTIPVVMITGHSAREKRIMGIEAGAEDFISKPFDAMEVLARIGMLLRVKKLNGQLDAAYHNITSLVAFGEGLTAAFDPLNFDLKANVMNMFRRFIARSPEMTESPRVVLVGMREPDGSCTMDRYWYSGSDLAVAPVEAGSLYSPFLPVGDSRIAFFNRADFGEPIREQLTSILSDLGIAPANLVCHLGDNISLYALNYGRQVSQYDAEVLNSVVNQTLFLKSLSLQVKETEDAFAYTVYALARASEANDDDTGNHISRVGGYCALLARHLGMPEKFVDTIRLQSSMHDVGKIHTPPAILKKPGKLDPEEFEIIKQHPVQGATIIGDHVRLTLAKSIALSHHERFDGTGYPYGLKGDRIPIEGRIMAMADHYDALRNPRVYKPALDHVTTIRIITEGDGRTLPHHFDPRVLAAFREISGHFAEIYDGFSTSA